MAARPFESKIQDIVYNVDVGIGIRLIKLGLFLLVLLSIMVLYTATQFRGLKDAEAMDYAQVGRNLMDRGHFLTQNVRPASMWYLIEHSKKQDPLITQHPDILHPPLYPMLLAVGFKMFEGSFSNERTPARTFPPEQWVIVPFSHLCTIFTGILVFLLARRLFDQRVALLSITLFFLSDAVWGMSISGLGIPLAALLTTGAIYAALLAAQQHQEGRSWIRWFIPVLVSSLLCALAFLTRYGTIAIVPAVALLLGWSFRSRASRVVILFLAIFAIAITPWLVRNQMVSGGLLGLAPYTALNGTDPVDGNLFERTLAQTLTMGGIINSVQGKLMTGLANLYNKGLRTMGDGILVCFFLTTFFYSFAREQVRRLRWCLAVGMLLTLVLAAIFGDVTARLLHLFWPFALIYAVGFFYILLDRMQLRIPILRMGVTAAFVLLGALPLIFTMLPPRAGVPYPPYFPPYISHVCRMLTDDELLCTDMPWATAWYGNRNSLLLPATLDEFYEINDYTKRVSGIYFTTLTRDREYVRTLMTGPYRTWFPILEGRIPSDFPLTQGFPLNNFDQLFLTDRPRWQ
jgi:4-amino-4-deoxy-L-arabinose transferase-like glycosyltransferase